MDDIDRRFYRDLARGATYIIVACIALCLGVATCSDIAEQRSMERCSSRCGDGGVRAFDPCECEHGQTQTIHVRSGDR
jgi:hypothetical protein